jgi:hypothetical protein
MKKTAVAAILAVAGFLSAGSALADSTHEIRVNIPFAFAVGKKVLPAGNYRIDSVTSPASANEVLIQDVDHPRFAILVRGTDGPWEALPTSIANRGRLVFDRYGDDHFLREIRGPLAAVNVDIPISAAEQHVQNRETTSLANPSQTTIALN